MQLPFLIPFIAVIAVFSGCSQSADSELGRLDEVLKRYPSIMERRLAYIDSIREAEYDSPFRRHMAMQATLGSYSLDSAIMYSNEALAEASTPAELVEATLALARHYNTSGVMYKEADELFRSIDRKSVDDAGLTFPYFSLAVQLNRNLAAHSLDPDLKAAYLDKKVAYRDSALMLDPTNEVLLANRYMDKGDYQRAIAMMRRGLDDNDVSHDAAIRFNILAQLYQLDGDRENARRYLALSAACDLREGVREYLSLQDLAMMLYEDGDYDRAYRYIHQSISDATACNAKLRMLEMSTMLPIIELAYEQKQTSARNLLIIFMTVIAVLSVALLFVMHKIRRKNHKLARMNIRQKSLNERLAESDKIKEEYLTRFMNLCLEYLAQMESYRRQLLRIAARKNFDDLCAAIESEKYIGKGISDFLDKFDEAFLKIFPTFVEDFKALLRPGYQFRMKKNEALNTELRIFALMRLGISDSDSICRFLRCSPSTIYNYRTKLRNEAIDRDNLEKAVMLLGR